MNIYEDDGELDLDKARAELKITFNVTDNSVSNVRRRYAELQIAAMLDIAGSLRILALEAGQAMGLEGAFPADESEAQRVTTPEDLFTVGDVVTVIGSTEPAEITSFGYDEGELFAIVDFAETKAVKYYVRNLERVTRPLNPEAGLGLVGTVGVEDALAALREPETIADLAESDVPLVGVATEAETTALLTDEDEDGEEAVGGYELDAPENEPSAEDLTDDDIDADFDGDHHPAAADALEKLKANEAARKAAAKKGKKK